MIQPVSAQGHNFIKADGAQFSYVGVSDFALFKRWLMPNGRAALVTPRLDEWRAYAGSYNGPIVLRVFRYASPTNLFGMDPWSYDFAQMRVFAEFCAARSFYIDWTCGDSQVVLPNPSDQQEHLNRTCAAVVGLPGFIETCNEPFKNGIDTLLVIPPFWGGYLRDSGYYSEIQTWNAANNLDYLSYHSGRDTGGMSPWPKWLIDMNDQLAVLMNAFHKPVVLKEPIGFAEENIPGRRSNDPVLAFRMGQIVSYGGVTFHSDDGRDGDHLRPVQATCARAFFAGVAGAL